jgi:hypothetical protein
MDPLQQHAEQIGAKYTSYNMLLLSSSPAHPDNCQVCCCPSQAGMVQR